MTNEEARRILLDIADQMPSDVCADWIDAIGLGIKALEQQPSDDCISRDEATEGLTKLINNLKGVQGDMGGAVNSARELIKTLPSVIPQQRWIPVSERLPEEYKRVLVSDSWSGVYIGQYIDAEESWGGEHFINESGMHSKTVEAWQPLPQPYKEEQK